MGAIAPFLQQNLCAVLSADRKDAVEILSQVIVESHWLPELHVLPASPELENTERELFSSHIVQKLI